MFSIFNDSALTLIYPCQGILSFHVFVWARSMSAARTINPVFVCFCPIAVEEFANQESFGTAGQTGAPLGNGNSCVFNFQPVRGFQNPAHLSSVFSQYFA